MALPAPRNKNRSKQCNGRPIASNKIGKDYKYRLPRLKYHVPRKPQEVLAVSRFTKLKADKDLTKCLIAIIDELRKHDRESHFFRRVDIEGYSQTIAKPVHFGQIQERIKKEKYSTFGDIKKDTDLLWANCFKFNGQPDINKKEERGFSNFAAEIQWVYNVYVDDLVEQFIENGWIRPNKQKQKKVQKKRNLKVEPNDDRENSDFIVAVKNEFEPKRKKRKIDKKDN